MYAPGICDRMVVAEPDFDEHPYEEERQHDPERLSRSERGEAAPNSLDQSEDHDCEHGEVREVGVDRRRAEPNCDARLVGDVQEEDRDRRGKYARTRRYAPVRKSGRQGDGDYTLA